MTQIVSSSFSAKSFVHAKGLDFAFVIAGWPTIYTVGRESYVPAGDLAPWAMPDSDVRACADIPKIVSSAPKGRPEEGSLATEQLEITILDRITNGTRSLTHLLQREALRTSAGPLDGDLSQTATSIVLSNVSGLPVSGGIVFIGSECVKYESASSFTNTLSTCTRGYRLTSATAHHDGSTVWHPNMPTLDRRRAYLYKGYEDLPMSEWVPAFGGFISHISKFGPAVTFTVDNTLAHTSKVGFGIPTDLSNPPVQTSAQYQQHALSGDFTMDVGFPFGTTNLSNGHYLMDAAGHWQAITGVT